MLLQAVSHASPEELFRELTIYTTTFAHLNGTLLVPHRPGACDVTEEAVRAHAAPRHSGETDGKCQFGSSRLNFRQQLCLMMQAVAHQV